VIYSSFSVISIVLMLSVLAPFGSFSLSELTAPFRRAGSADAFRGGEEKIQSWNNV